MSLLRAQARTSAVLGPGAAGALPMSLPVAGVAPMRSVAAGSSSAQVRAAARNPTERAHSYDADVLNGVDSLVRSPLGLPPGR